VSLVDVTSGHDEEFLAIATHFEALLIRKEYGHGEMIRDEGHPRRFYAVRYWTDATAAERFHADPEAQALTAGLYRIARVTHVVNGVHKSAAMRLMLDDRRARIEADRRTGFDRRVKDAGRSEGNRRVRERRIGPRRVQDAGGEIDLIGAARRARENADAAFSHFKVGAALEAGDGAIITGCNIENATYGLTLCAERRQPPDSVGVRRQPRDSAREPARGKGQLHAEGSPSAAVRRPPALTLQSLNAPHDRS